MSAKKTAQVIIGGKVFSLSGYEEEDYLQKVASYINAKIDEYSEIEDYKKLTSDMKSILIELNIADDYFKAKDQIDKYETDLAAKDKEVYDLKHELITDRVKVEDLESEVAQLKAENDELKKNKSKLEASLEDALLGTGGLV
ncbi:MAG: cell division protein ZapA [Lachnospiraceae bacterium]|nr:cell division protein ZapA [Lachnospiraceae bacterium]